MSETIIHPTAIVSAKAELGSGVKIGPYSILDDDVVVGDNTEIRSGVYLADGARIGNNCRIHTNAIISTEPQDLKYRGEKTFAYIGDNTVIREFATVNRGTNETGETRVGNDCLLMTYCHVAHDCQLGNNIIMSNVSQLAGHVTIGDYSILGGVVKIHQFCKVGPHTMIGADLFVNKDVAPYTLLGRVPPRVEGVNKIGLKRRGFSTEIIKEIELFYDTLLFSGLNNRDGIKKYKERGEVPVEVQLCIDFIENSNRGIHR